MQELKIKQISDGLSFSRAQKLGKGAFGEVFLGFDDNRKVPCAFKIINLEKLSTQVNAESLMKKIKDEIVNMQLAHHESIIEFQQAKQSPHNIYILCEYCNGESLARYIQRRHYLTQWQAIKVFKEIIKGFYHLRKNNIVHRDLKPANLLMHNFTIKIGDLGFSKVTEHHQQMLESIVGTPMYMSPQIFEREKYTEKTDIWSLGVILYEMLYGRNPWAGSKNLFELKQRIKKDVIFPQFPSVSRSLKITIRQMLVVRQMDRISWETLFQQYLPNIPADCIEMEDSCLPSEAILNHFKNSLYLQNRLQLPKVALQLNLMSQQQLNALLAGHSSSGQFYSQVLFISKNKNLIGEYYSYYLQKRNQVSFIILLTQKVLRLGLEGHVELSAYCFCLTLLCYRYCLCILQELNPHGQLVLLNTKYLPVAGRFNHQKIMALLLLSDLQIIKTEYHRFLPIFKKMLQKIHTHQIASKIDRQLSGIYSNEQNSKTVIKFFTLNYMKKIFNTIKNIIQPQKAMLNQAEEVMGEQDMWVERMEDEQEGEEKVPPLRLIVARMIRQYLNSTTLFQTFQQGTNKNLAQHFYDWQTTFKDVLIQEIQKTNMKEDSTDSLLKALNKELLWSQMFNRPRFDLT